jgi:hypothetical protein
VSAAIRGAIANHLAALIVWIPMLPGDSDSAAVAAASQFGDQGVWQFYDSGSLAGRAVAASLGADGHVAWDVYLTYSRDAEWASHAMPEPREYVHQLGRSWANQSRYLAGDALRDEIARMVRAAVADG